MRLSLGAQPLLGPVVAEAEGAIAFPAPGHEHTVRALAQRIFHERRRELTDAQQARHRRIGSLQRTHVSGMVAAEHDDLCLTLEARNLQLEPAAQLTDRQPRHVDAAY